MRRWLFLFTLSLGACNTNAYPAEAREWFDSNCELASEHCLCVWEGMQERIPYEDWKALFWDQPSEEVHGPEPKKGIEATTEWKRLHETINKINNWCQD